MTQEQLNQLAIEMQETLNLYFETRNEITYARFEGMRDVLNILGYSVSAVDGVKITKKEIMGTLSSTLVDIL